MLATWSASPARFREDANAEELLSIGYGDRVIAELAANGADAARAAGVAGEIEIAVVGRELRVANNGAPLDSAGVAALAALRASAKRDSDTVGHFGVGFTAVRALCDDVEVVSTTGAIAFSAAETRSAVEGLDDGSLLDEVHRRGGQVPALRLPWPVAVRPERGGPGIAPPPAGFTTEVRLALRDGIDEGALADSLTVDLATDLLWALDGVAAVTTPAARVERRDDGDGGIVHIVVRPGADAAGRAVSPAAPADRAYRVGSAAGTLPADLLADRPVEERRRAAWRLAWIVPLDDAGHPARLSRSLVGAPTATEEPIAMPARLVITVPVDESRGRVAPGPLTDYLIGEAAAAYATLLRRAPADDRIALLPPAAFPVGEFDAALRRAVGAELERTECLPGASGRTLRPADAVLVAGLAGAGAVSAAEALPGLMAWPGRAGDVEPLRALGVRIAPVADVTAALAALDRPVSFWRSVYDALDGLPTDDLGDLPVPRSGGGTIIGPRDVLLPVATPPADGASEPWPRRAARLVPGLRLAAEGSDHPLLRRLGARPADAAAILSDTALRHEIRRRIDDLDSGLDAEPDADEVADFASMVLDLVAESGRSAADPGILADLLLTDESGEPWPAGELLMPGAPLRNVLSDEADPAVIAPHWITRYGADLLETVGVRAVFGVRRHPLPPPGDVDLPDVESWWDEVGDGFARLARGDDEETFTAVTDLDFVAQDAWPQALAMIAEHRHTRDALRHTAFGPSYSSWWISRNAVIDGVPLRRWRTADASDLEGLYDEIVVPLPAELGADLGLLRGVADAAGDPAELLRRWADPTRTVPSWSVPRLTGALIAALADHPAGEPPATVRVLTGAVIDADDAVVLDKPFLAQVLDSARLVAGGSDPNLVADVLDLPTASEGCRFDVPAPAAGRDSDSGEPARLGSLPGARRCLGAAGRADLAGREVFVIPDLSVVGGEAGATATLDRKAHRVRWWVDGDRILLDGSADGIGRAVAHLAGRWGERHRFVAAARDDAIDLAEAGLD